MSRKNDYIYIFSHIPKCAGSTFSFHIRKNFSEEERLEFSLDKIDLESKSEKRYMYKYTDYIRGVENYFNKLGEEKKDRIRIIYGHITPYGIHKFFEKDPLYFTFLREPAKRAVSLYNYWRTRYDDEPEGNKNKLYFTRNLLIDGEVLGFRQWLQEKYDNKLERSGSNTMAHYLKIMGYLNTQCKIVNSALDKFNFIGLSSSFESDSLFLYEKLGISKFFLNKNISRNYASENDIAMNQKLIAKKNRSDIELYNLAQKKNLKIRELAKYEKKVKKMRVKRALLLPFTQLLYDLVGTRHALPGVLRKKLNLN